MRLNNMESIDILDSFCSSIRIDYLNNKIYRILPIYNKYLNEDWITNKIRFCYDSHNSQRFFYPLLKVFDKYINLNWMDSFNLFFFNLIFFFLVGKIKVFFGNFIDIESVFSLKNFFQRFGIEINLVDINFIVNDFRYNFIFIDLDFDTFNYVLVNLNLRVEIPLLNSKLKKKMMKNNFNIYNFSGKDVLGKFLNNDFLNYSNIFSFRQKLCYFLLFFTFLYICFNFLKNLVSVKFFFGWNFFQRNYFFFNNLFLKLTNKYNIITYNIILSTISLINYFEFFYVKISNINLNLYNSFVFLAQVDDELFLNKLYLLKDKDINSFFVYSGSFFDNGAKISNLIFPLNMFFEYNGLFLNLSGKFRKNRKVVSSLSFLYNISSLFESFNNFFVLKIVGLNFFYFSIFSFFKKFKFYLCFYVIYFFDLKKIYIEEDKFLKFGLYSNILFKSLIWNSYKSDVISKNSKVLSLASINYMSLLKSLI